MNLMNARGVRDFVPEEKIPRQEIVEKLKTVFELYGFVPIETPLIERMDILAAKYAGGSEILKETFQFKDQGDRELGLRYDLTVPFSRFVGMNPTMKMPFKRYQIGRVFRDGPIKLGRYREFWQCDVDIVGAKSISSDAQCVQIAQKVFKQLDLEVKIEINSRDLLEAILREFEISDDLLVDVILEIDKLKKIGIIAVKEAILNISSSLDASKISELLDLLTVSGTNKEKIDKIKLVAQKEETKLALNKLIELFTYVSGDDVVFRPSLARGLSYYTGTVFEVVLKNQDFEDENGKKIKFTSSLSAGGRYDNMIGDYLESKKEFPAVGISFGLEPIVEVMKLSKKIELKKTTVKAYVIPIKTFTESNKIAEKLRDSGINCDIDLVNRSISKNLNYANSFNIPFVIFVGQDELDQDKVKLRDMSSGEESLLSIKEVCEKLK
ncbi:histidine--tRNA ligase [Candidatus Woesearchaeota archaeon]|nr:histidine--tRNA ligase [Candidatus Woesearchaeota archaeon]